MVTTNQGNLRNLKQLVVAELGRPPRTPPQLKAQAVAVKHPACVSEKERKKRERGTPTDRGKQWTSWNLKFTRVLPTMDWAKLIALGPNVFM